MPTTAKGYRYPAATDLVAQTHTHIANLAGDLDAKIQAGNTTVNTTASALGSVAVVFPVAYPSGVVPKVVASSADSRYIASPSSVTNTGFTLFVREYQATAATVAVPCSWHAIP